MPDLGVVIVAAGSGTRLGADVPKALVPIAGHPLLSYAVRAALPARDLAAVVVVAPAAYLDDVADLVEPMSRAAGVMIQVVPGGAERGDSVLSGVRWLPESCDRVLIHDAARAFAPTELFDRVADALSPDTAAVVPGLPVIDTVKVVDASGAVVSTPDRATLRSIQTPQGFRRDVLLAAHARYGSVASDDALLVERMGAAVRVVDGHPAALKVTTPDDLQHAQRLAAALGPHPA